MPKSKFFAPGKLPHEFMSQLLSHFQNPIKDLRVAVAPRVGQDFGAIVLGDRYLIVKSNPVTFATDEIGYYAVTLNANDVATSGAKPRWFASTILLPEKSTDEVLCEQIFKDIAKECQKMDIAVIAGHTEVTFGLDRPIISGMMLGEVAKDKLITTMGAQPGDALMITKGIAIEGSSIIAREKENELISKGIDSATIQKGKELLHNPGISVVREAELISSNFDIHAMHGPTEGGLNMGIIELVRNSHCGVILDKNAIPFISPTKELCMAFELNPLQTIASGCLLFTINPDIINTVQDFLKNNGINCTKIGDITNADSKYKIIGENGEIQDLKSNSVDEITKIF